MATRSNKLLGDWVKRLEGHLNLDGLVLDCCNALLTLSGADRCSIMVLEADTEELAVRWAQGLRVTPYGRMKFKVGEGLCGWVARSQKPLFSFDVTKEPRFLPPRTSRHSFQPIRAFCCLPLLTQGRTVGVVNLSSFHSSSKFRYCVRARFTKEFLEQLARVIARVALLRGVEDSALRWRRLVKATSDTVAQVSHEVRTPLTLISEGAQQLLDGLGGPLTSQQKQIAGTVKAQGERMLRLVTELLDISRIEAGRLSLHRRPIEMAQVIEEVRASYQQLISPRKLKLEIKQIPPIYGDCSRLTQVAENLLTNAIKFTPTTGSITLGLCAHGRSGEITVSDTGMGIPLKEQRRLFEKFFQPRVPSSLEIRGTGLGLAIVKEIVQMHGGTIRVASQPNHGTTFTVSLPLYTPQFALTEEFRLMREQAAREGTSLACQLLWAKPISSVSWEEVSKLLEKHVSREDKVLVNPEGGLLLLSVSDPAGFQAMRRRLEEVLRFHPEALASSTLRWGWAFVPQDGTQLSETLTLAKKRGEEKGGEKR